MFPTIKDNPDYTAIVAQRHYDRIMGHIEDARAKGARIVEIKPEGEDLTQQEHRKIAPTLIIDPTDDMTVMQEEIFGPVLPVKTYAGIEDAIGYVNAHDRPLGLYYFGDDAAERDLVLAATTSGGVTVNDVIFHIAQEELPFGGVGHGQLPRPGRLQGVQPQEVGLHPAEKGHRPAAAAAAALRGGDAEVSGGADQAVRLSVHLPARHLDQASLPAARRPSLS
jgi:acyl-CoA reductase-like NAD-dependent aldehyde dehydrogenase